MPAVEVRKVSALRDRREGAALTLIHQGIRLMSGGTKTKVTVSVFRSYDCLLPRDAPFCHPQASPNPPPQLAIDQSGLRYIGRLGRQKVYLQGLTCSEGAMEEGAHVHREAQSECDHRQDAHRL